MKRFVYLIIIAVSLILYTLTIRGNVGNPTPQEINGPLKSTGQAFETSQERARYALILSLVNDKSFAIDHYASLGTPDIGRAQGHYYSFFPPGASVLALPLYLLGINLGAAQMMTFLLSTIFALLTMLLIARFILKLDLHWSAALFGAFAFGFATNAWGYSVTFYAHIISAFLLLGGLYLTLFMDDKKVWTRAIIVWILYGFSVFIDFPNFLIYFPIVLLLTLKTFKLQKDTNKIIIRLDWRFLLAPLVFVVMMIGYGYYNYVHYGNPTTLSNFLPRVKDVDAIQLKKNESGREATSALKTRNMLEGFRSFIISDDRGIIKYSPIVLLFIFGLGYLKRERKKIEITLFSIAITCLTLYTMFGDPYGGWAFGSRYLIAVLPELCILAAIGLHRFGLNENSKRDIAIKGIYSLVFIYSAGVSLLAPLTTNVIPPQVEASGLGLESNYNINWKMLQFNELNSFFYNHILHHSISGYAYYNIILEFVVIIGLILIWYPKNSKN